MKGSKHMKTITNIIYPALMALGVACFVISPKGQAQLPSPTPDGGYPGQNTAEGDGALFSLTTGTYNTAIGFHALYYNNIGIQNTATGAEALYNNTTGIYNTATGVDALANNTEGSANTATGGGTLISNTTGNNNTATGVNALLSNTTGGGNVATGPQALASNISGTQNTATGQDTLLNNTTGDRNMAFGVRAGFNLTTGDDNIDIGNEGVATESNTIRIGTAGTQTATYIAGINGVTVSGEPVVVDSSGHLGTGAITPGSVVMLPVAGGVAPPAPAGYSFKGFDRLAAKANGGGGTTSYAVYTKD
jgi:hypothetical protein